MIQCTQDIDIEELESHLYSQVFHSAVNTEFTNETTASNITNQTSIVTNKNSDTQRSFVNNNPGQSTERYWCTKNTATDTLHNQGKLQQNEPTIPLKVNSIPTLNEFIPIVNVKTKNKKKKKKKKQNKKEKKINFVDSYPNPGYNRPLDQQFGRIPAHTSYIPPLIQINPFNQYKSFYDSTPHHSEPIGYPYFRNINPSYLNLVYDLSTSDLNYTPPNFINNQPQQRAIEPPKPLKAFKQNKTQVIVKPTSTIIKEVTNSESTNTKSKTDATDIEKSTIIHISDSESDDDSVEVIPQEPDPIFEISSSDENEDTDKKKIETITKIDGLNVIDVDKIELNQTDSNNSVSVIFETTPIEKSNDVNIETANQIIEAERKELLVTPDSNTNDFIVNDMNHIEENEFCFNFNLIEPDLDISEKGVTKKNLPSLDVYESESNCSSASTPTKLPVFSEVHFEKTQNLFCESDMSYFSNFIIPVRTNKTLELKQVMTKATKEKRKKINEEKGSSEFDSDPTVFQKKRSKKKKKKHETQEEEVICNKLDKAETISDKSKNKPKKKKSTDKSMKLNTCLKKSTDLDENLTDGTGKKSPKADNLKSRETNKKEFKNTTHDDEVITEEPKKVTNKKNTTNETCYEPPKNDTQSKTFDKKKLPEKSDEVTTQNSSISTESEIVDLTHDDKSNTDQPVSKLSSGQEETQIECITHLSSQTTPPNLTTNIQLANVKQNKSVSIVTSFWTDTAGSSKEVDHSNDFKSFKDFWTSDMTKFYDESWGQENYDINLVKSGMSSDSSNWTIIPEDMFPNKNRKPFCVLCKNYGHSKYSCSKKYEPKILICSICGDREHCYTRCPNLICTSCGYPNRYYTTSCNRCAYFRNMHCSICNLMGHPEKVCPDSWRRYHVTSSKDSEIRISTNTSKSADNLWCSGCASRGHLYHECRARIIREHFPTTPYVICLDKTIPKSDYTDEKPNSSSSNPNYSISQLQNRKNRLANFNNCKYSWLVKGLRKKCEPDFRHFLPDVRNMENILMRRNITNSDITKFHNLRKKINKGIRDLKRHWSS